MRDLLAGMPSLAACSVVASRAIFAVEERLKELANISIDRLFLKIYHRLTVSYATFADRVDFLCLFNERFHEILHVALQREVLLLGRSLARFARNCIQDHVKAAFLVSSLVIADAVRIEVLTDAN